MFKEILSKEEKIKTMNNKMAITTQPTSINLNVNGLNAPTKDIVS